MHTLLFFAQQPGHELMKRELSTSEMSLSIAVLVFTLALVGVVAAIALKQGQAWSPTTTKLFIIIVVVGGSLFLLTAGYSQDQMTPIIGLLGTIIGYALGRKDEKA